MALEAHLFPGDGDEHGASLSIGVVRTDRGIRLLARDFFPAVDGVDYVAGQRGYRMLTPKFVTDRILDCTENNLGYLAVHCHGGTDTVSFSGDDLASHERGYSALREIADGHVVGALVLAQGAAAGDIWFPDGTRACLASMRVIGRPILTRYPQPPAPPRRANGGYDRQARLFGDRGQDQLAKQKVGVIGSGGAGSLLIEYLARLGVGEIVTADPDRFELSNHSRIVGSRRRDARAWLTDETRPRWVRSLGNRLAVAKVRIARRVAREANPDGDFHGVRGSVVDASTSRRFVDCDYLFLAADTMQARLVFNAIVHQYLIPGVQVGAKVTTDKETGDVLDVFTATRPVNPDLGCLWCNGLILASRLAEEAISEDQRNRQRYVDEPTVTAPSVITLNALSAAHAANEYLFVTLGLLKPGTAHGYLRVLPLENSVIVEEPRRAAECIDCGASPASRLGRGDAARLPTRIAR